MSRAPLLEVRNVTVRYRRHGDPAVRGVTLAVGEGESVGLVGESGSGKTTLARVLLGTLAPSDGDVRRPVRRPDARASVAMVFQDVAGSLDPLFSAQRAIEEASPLPRRARRVRTLQLLELVGLDRSLLARYPHELSGGQRQRVALARALASGAHVLLLDEPTSALDAHARLQVIALLERLKEELGLSYLVVSHDFQVVARLCQRIAVMAAGEIVEEGPAEEVLRRPQNPFTAALIRASEMRREPSSR